MIGLMPALFMSPMRRLMLRRQSRAGSAGWHPDTTRAS
jgi:hypothetical protein